METSAVAGTSFTNMTVRGISSVQHKSKKYELKVKANDKLLPKGKTVYHCDVCDRDFNRRINFLNHAHKQRFRRRESAQQHDTNNEPQRQTYQCDMCKKVLVSKNGLITHHKRHLRMYSHKCEICEKPFYDSHSLRLHINSRHTGKDKFVCDLCETV
ncbi:myoneurin-like [Cylas formicarius]|uniref:myoneurin-like n=1 Tax=Cylas formicarius TaxID=197179 RepID=UPI002958A0FF|nr:myoneurin-like [Cylas formicarius]